MAMEAASVASFSHAITASSRSTVSHLPSPSPAFSHRLTLPQCKGLRRFVKPPPPSSSGSVSHRRTYLGIVCEQKKETLSPAGAVTDKTWKELVLDSDIPVLVDFWAPWCGPCRMIAPLVDELAVQFAGKVKCLKLNTDESPNTSTQYGVRSIPTVMIFKKGVKKDTIIGAVPKAALVSAVEKFLDR